MHVQGYLMSPIHNNVQIIICRIHNNVITDRPNFVPAYTLLVVTKYFGRLGQITVSYESYSESVQ